MKKRVLLAVVILLVVTALVQAQEELHGVAEFTYQSKYVWRGFDIYDDKSAVQGGVNVDLFGTGFGVSAMGHRANSGEFENGERWDYTLYYMNALYPEEYYTTQYMVGWVYYNYPDHSQKTADLQEAFVFLSWPNLLGVEGLIPRYYLAKLWPNSSKSPIGCNSPTGGTASGYAHIFMLDYALPVEGLLPDVPEQILNLHSEFVFNDGVDPRGIGVDHDWSNATFGITTDFELAENVTLTPGIHHQVTMDKSVNNDKDETWATVSVKYSF
jgi:hypothetical protein